MKFVTDIFAKSGLIVDGSVTLNTTPNANVDTDKFLVQDGLVVKYRTGAEVLSDIGAQGALTLTVIGNSGPSTLIGNGLNIPTYTLAGLGGVPLTRTITINGNTQDLSANRSWSVGTVTSVDMSVPTGLSISGNPITGSGTLAVSLTVGYSIPTTAAQANWNSAYNNMVAAISYNTSTGDITLTQQDFGTLGTTITLQPFTTTNLAEGANLYYTDTRARNSVSLTTTGTTGASTYTPLTGVFNIPVYQGQISLTTVGSGGASTFVGNTLNIPDYSLALSGYVPISRTLTINGTGYDLSANRTWNVGTVTSVDMSVPTGFAISGNPVTTSGTLALAFASGYSLPSNATQATWTDAYNNMITAFSYNTSSGVLTLTQQDLGTLTATVTLQPFTTTNLAEGTNLYYTDTRARNAISLTTSGTTGSAVYTPLTGILNIPVYQGQITLTTSGSSGSSTLVGNTLNIPTYTISGLGGVPNTRTINGLALSNDQTFAVGTTGTDFNIVSAGTVHTFNIPDADQVNRGFITPGTQTIGGAKTFASPPTVPSLYLANMGAGSGVLYYDLPDNRVTLANYNVGGEIKFEVNGGNYTMTLNSDLTIELMGYTTNGFVKTSGGNGLLVIDTTTYTPTSTTLTINGTSFNLSANRTWNVGTVTSVGLTAPTGFSVANSPVTSSGTIALSFASGYSLPTNASQTNWDTAYNNRITSLTTTGTSGPATLVSNVLNIPQYQAQGNYITALTGEATASGPGSASVTLTNSAVIGKVLTGLSVTSGAIASTDSILQAFGKVQGQINALSGGLQFQGTWNANTNTPTITSGVGSLGYFYIVNVAGNTTIDGNTGWQVGDWILFDGTVWQKVDNTDAVTSVNGQTGAVVLTTTNISEGTNLYYTNARARQAISLTTTGSSGAATYSNVTGVLNIPQYTLTGLGGVPSSRTLTINGTALDLSADRSWSVGTVTSVAASGPLFISGSATVTPIINISQANTTTSGFLSSTDWNTFNNKQNAITLTTTGSSGSATLVGATLNIPSYTLSGLGGVPTSTTLTINGTSFDLSANRTWSVGTITSITFSGPLTGGTITGSGTVGITQASGSASGFLSSTDWNTFNSKQNAITLTTTGSSGAATFVGATLNIPNYTLSGLGGVPTSRTLTINGTAYDLSADRSWSVGTVTSVSATAGTGISVSGSPITGSGTLTITNTGVTSLTAGTGISVSASTGGITVTNTAPAPANTVTGTGTLNYVARWTSTSAIGTGILYDDGSVVCVNATGPEYTEKLRVVGGVSVQQAYTQVNALQRVGVVSALTTTTAGGAGYYSGLAYTALTGAHENIFNGSVTIPNSVGVGGVSSIATLRFNVSSVSVTMTQATGFRAYSAVSGSIAFSTAQTGGSVSHVASFHALAPYYVGTNTPTITNYYGLLLNDSTEYNTWVAITNRWGVYQAGSSDRNHFNGTVLIGTTTDAGYKLDVNGSIRGTSFVKTGGTSTQYLMADGSVSTLSNPTTGTGTTNYITKWTGSSTIGNSQIFDNGNNVLYGTTSSTGYYTSDVIGVAGGKAITIDGAYRNNWGADATTPTSTTFQSRLNIWTANSDHITFGGSNTVVRTAWEDFYLWINNDSGSTGTLHLQHTSSQTEFARFAGSGNSWINAGNFGVSTNNPANNLQIGSMGSTGYSGNHLAIGNGSGGVFAIWQETGRTNIYTSTFYSFQLSGSGTGNFVIGSTTDSGLAKLQVSGAIQQTSVTSSMLKVNSSGVLVAAIAGTDYLTATSADFTYNASLTLSTSWQDTGVSNSNLTNNGVYVVTCYVNDFGVSGGQYTVTYTGMMYWYASSTNNTNVNEIALHHMGHADNDRYIYLRTRTTPSGAGSYLQIKGNGNNSGASTYTFTFKRLL